MGIPQQALCCRTLTSELSGGGTAGGALLPLTHHRLAKDQGVRRLRWGWGRRLGGSRNLKDKSVEL